LTLKKIEAGSVKLVLEGSQDGLRRIEALFREGQLTEILGIPIQHIQEVASEQGILSEAITQLSRQLSIVTSNSERILLRTSSGSPVEINFVNSGIKLGRATTLVESPGYSFLQAIVDSFVDGVLILSEQGACLHANERAHQVCRQLSQDISQTNSIPQEIWQVCESLIDSRNLFPNARIIIESRLHTDNSTDFRIRTRWLEIEASAQPYLLVIIEELSQSPEDLAIKEVKEYGLTSREADVWLLRRANHSYKEIAAELSISLNTVKKHIRNIIAKQQAFLDTIQR
jgi:DNA-binding CsgD family transcriptional regulator/PAS domain-containing protein